MAITVNIYYSGEGDNAELFAQEMLKRGIVDKIRGEKGNIRYEYFIPLESANTILLIDSWENQDALDAHHNSPMMSDIISLREKYKLTMRVERYIRDEEIPDSDKKFIKDR